MNSLLIQIVCTHDLRTGSATKALVRPDPSTSSGYRDDHEVAVVVFTENYPKFHTEFEFKVTGTTQGQCYRGIIKLMGAELQKLSPERWKEEFQGTSYDDESK